MSNEFKLTNYYSYCVSDFGESFVDDQWSVIGSGWRYIYSRIMEGRQKKKDRILTFDIYIRNFSPAWANEQFMTDYTPEEQKRCFGLDTKLKQYYIEIGTQIEADSSCLFATEKIGPFKTYDQAFDYMRMETCPKYKNLSEDELYSYFELHGPPNNYGGYYFPAQAPYLTGA